MSPKPSEPGSLRSLALTVYLPAFLFAIGQGAVVPILPLAAREVALAGELPSFLDALTFASIAAAMRQVGVLCFDLPAGWLVSRFGEQRAMGIGTGIVAVSLVGSVGSTSPWVFAAFTFLMGCAWSVWLLARLSYVTDVTLPEQRGRALSTLGGVNRAGNFVGPFLGAVVSGVAGLEGAYYIHIVTAVLASVALLFTEEPSSEESRRAESHARLGPILREHAPVFLTAGVGVAALGALRAARQIVLPLWCVLIGLDATAVSLIFGISTGMETLLFYPAGSAMDRFGRRAVVVPCLSILSVGMLLLPLTTDFMTVTLVGLLLGFGNGLGSGIVMTLGADFAPKSGRAHFLSAWRLCTDVGVAGGPLLVSAAVAVASLAAGSVLIGGIGLVGTALFVFRMPAQPRY